MKINTERTFELSFRDIQVNSNFRILFFNLGQQGHTFECWWVEV